MNLNVGLNGTCFTNVASGANQRFLGIYGQLVAQNPNINFTVYFSTGSTLPQQFPNLGNVEFAMVPIRGQSRLVRYVEGLCYWKKKLSNKHLDIFEQFHLPLVKSPSGSTILTIHDIRSVVSKNNIKERALGKLVFGKAIKEASHVITVSNSMKQEILNYFPYANISVIYNGLDPGLGVNESELAQFKSKFSLPNEFLLSVGHLEVRKNYRRLIEALALLKDRGESLFLLIVGNDNGEKAQLQKFIESMGMSFHVRFLNGLSHSEIQCAYRLSQLFIFPSKYEGFGIPVLEAMAAGIPMVLSDIPVFREITENQGIYFSPEDTEDMAAAITNALDSVSEQKRIISYGKRRVEDFNFIQLSRQIRDLYKKLS